MENEILTVNHAVKRFGGLTALDDASIHVNKGEIVGLIGPNGAGKTTMFNAIDSVFRLTSGTVHFKGEDISALPPNKRCLLGIGRTFQITKPFGGMTVLENVAVGAMFGKNSSENILSSKLMRQSMEYAEEVLKKMDFYDKRNVRASTLNVPERKRLEICRALATNPDLLLLDEVIAGLNPSEVGDMVDLIRQVNQNGVTILMIEHVMRAVMSLSDRMYVLSFGKLIAEGTPSEICENPIVIEAYLGKIGQKEAKRC